jgi:hypothetical protein
VVLYGKLNGTKLCIKSDKFGSIFNENLVQEKASDESLMSILEQKGADSDKKTSTEKGTDCIFIYF